MRRLWLVPVLSLLLIPALARPAHAQTADEVVEKILTALGGRDALTKLTSRRAIGTVVVSSPAGDINGTVEIDAKTPNKSRTHLELDLSAMGLPDKLVIDQRFDGTNASFTDSRSGDVAVTPNQVQNASNNLFPTPLLTAKQRGVAIEMLPKETIGTKSYIVLKATPKMGSAVKMIIDPDTYLPFRTVTVVEMAPAGVTEKIEQTSELSDYRAVMGVKVPFKFVNSNPNQSATFTFQTVEHNVNLPDSLFVKGGSPAPASR